MEREKAITLRFRPDSVPDMELYGRLMEEKARMGISMPGCAKTLLNKGLKAEDADISGARLMDGIRECVHDEMMAFCAGIIATLPQAQATRSASASPRERGGQETLLPEASDNPPPCLDMMLEKFK